MVKNLAAATSDPALRKAILPGCLETRPFGFQTRHLQKRDDISIKLRVSVQNHVTEWAGVRKGLTQLLDDPLRSRMSGYVEVQNLAASVLDHEETVQQPERQRWHGEEV